MRRALVAMLWCGCRWNFDALPDGEGDAAPDDAAMPASCANLAATCGPSQSSSCCATVVIPGGSYFRGYDVATDGLHSTTMFPATVSAFRLDTYEVTLGRFRAFVEAGRGSAPEHREQRLVADLERAVADGYRRADREPVMQHLPELDAGAGWQGGPADELHLVGGRRGVLRLGRRLSPDGSRVALRRERR